MNTNINTGSLQEKGIDFEAHYRRDLDDLGFPIKHAGAISVSYTGTVLLNYITEPVVGLGKYECVGFFGLTCGSGSAGNPLNQYRHYSRLTWEAPWDFQLSAAWRHSSGVKFDGNTNNPFLTQGNFNFVDSHIASYDYLDLSGTWNITDHLVFRAGINNVFDKDPPFVTSDAQVSASGAANTFVSSYDTLGRHIFMGVSYNF